MMMRKYGLMMGVALLGALSSGCFGALERPKTALGVGWQSTLDADLRKAMAGAAGSMKGDLARIVWAGTRDTSMYVIRGANDAPVAQEFNVVYAVEYPATKHCYWHMAKVRKEHLGGGNYGPPLLEYPAWPKEPVLTGSTTGKLLCEAVDTVKGGIKAPF
jgi:hypothetical protein